MHIAQNVVVLVHLLGFASLFGGFVVQLRSSIPEVNAAMLYGAWTQLVTGVALAVWAELGSEPINHTKLAVKLVLTIFIVLVVAKNRKFESVPRGLWALIGLLTVANTAMAVLWR
jgi:hypothetical protein